MVDEYLKGVVTLQTIKTERWVYPDFRFVAEATIPLHKVRNLRGEQNDLERSAIDSESLVCQVSETLYL